MSNTKEFLKKNVHWVGAALLLLLMVCFFSDVNIFGYFKTKRRVNNLHREMKHYRELIVEDSTFIYNLKTDDRFLEKYARERHLMHGESEQIFIIEE